MTLNVAIVGPGRSKQGTGPFNARTFKKLGCDVQAIVGSSAESANSAAEMLKNEYEIHCEAYTNLNELLSNHEIDIVVISSPAETHLDYLAVAVEAGCHIFCEKPFWWPSGSIKNEYEIEALAKKAILLIKQCNKHKTVLQLNTQWPFTLPTFFELQPKSVENNKITNFAMWLAPQSDGEMMIVDTLSHILSMLYALLGSGKIERINSNYKQRLEKQVLKIEFEYLHAHGDTHVDVSLCSSDTVPKPAAYAINGFRVDRHVELPDYLISLHSSNKHMPMIDPLESSVKNFLSTIHSKATSDEVALIDGMTHLAQIYLAVTQP